MINKILKELVEQHQQHQWERLGRDIGFFKARAELLCYAEVYIFSYKSNIVMPVVDDLGVLYATPLHLNFHGDLKNINQKEFKINIKEDFTVRIDSCKGIRLFSVDVEVLEDD